MLSYLNFCFDVVLFELLFLDVVLFEMLCFYVVLFEMLFRMLNFPL